MKYEVYFKATIPVQLYFLLQKQHLLESEVLAYH